MIAELAPEAERIARAVAEAKRLAAWGCGIVEVHPPRGDGSDSDGKRPVGDDWPKRATRSPHTIETIVGRHGQYGVIPWPGERILVLDVDHADRLPVTLPPGYRVTRGADRGHAYYRLPAGYNPATLPATAPWGEIRVEGASRQIVGPYSRHASGDVYTPHGDELTEVPAEVLEVLFPSPARPVLTVVGGGYELPDFGYTGSRYQAIRDYAAHLFHFRRSSDEAWVLVRDVLRPRFADALTEAEARSRFDRAWTDKMAGRLSQQAAAEPIAAVGIDAADLLELDLPPLRWIVPELVPEGTTIIASPPKVGKSCLVYQIVTEVAVGGELFGRRVAPGSALYYALEDGQRRGQTRLRAALAGRTMPRGRLEVRWSSRKLGAGLEDDLRAWLDDHADAAVIAIDTLGKVRAPTNGKRGAYELDVEDLGRLQELFRDRDVALIVVHHSRKLKGDDFLASVSGTYGITGSADTIISVERPRLEAFGSLLVTGRDIADAKIPARFDGLVWQSAAESLPEASFERLEVFRAIDSSGPIFPAAIAVITGLERTSIQHMVTRLVEGGAVARTAKGYVAVEPARAYISPPHSSHSGSDQSEHLHVREAEASPTVPGHDAELYLAHRSSIRLVDGVAVCDACAAEGL
jgi:hypothetical protein